MPKTQVMSVLEEAQATSSLPVTPRDTPQAGERKVPDWWDEVPIYKPPVPKHLARQASPRAPAPPLTPTSAPTTKQTLRIPSWGKHNRALNAEKETRRIRRPSRKALENEAMKYLPKGAEHKVDVGGWAGRVNAEGGEKFRDDVEERRKDMEAAAGLIKLSNSGVVWTRKSGEDEKVGGVTA